MAEALPPCDDHVLGIFLGQLASQADFALMAARDLASAAGLDGGPTDQRRLWYSVHAFVAAVANISKMIWPSYRSREQRLADRGERLRHLLDADSIGALRSRDLRNDFEHFDTRLEDWATTVAGRPFVDGNVNAQLVLRDIPSDRWLRNLDTQRMAITFRGKEYQLMPVAEAIRLLQTRVIAALSTLRDRIPPT